MSSDLKTDSGSRLEHGRRFLEKRIVIVPRPKFIDCDSVVGGQRRVDLGLGLVERLARQLLQLVEQFEQLLLALLAEIELHNVVVGESQFAGGLVPQGDQFQEIADNHRPDLLAGLPDGPAIGRVARFDQDLVGCRFR